MARVKLVTSASSVDSSAVAHRGPHSLGYLCVSADNSNLNQTHPVMEAIT